MIPVCDCCDKNKAYVLMRIGRRTEDWLFLQCDTCGEPICRECSASDLGDDDGHVECLMCAETKIRQQHGANHG